MNIKYQIASVTALLIFILCLAINIPGVDTTLISTEQSKEAQLDNFQNPDARAAYFKQIHGSEDYSQLKNKARIAIQRQFLAMDTMSNRDAGVNGWNDLGPKNIGGRTRAIAINPNDVTEIFIGGAAGGIWRSSDSGVNWTLRTSAPLAYPVTSIVYDPSNTNVIYATTGEYRGGGPEYPGIGVLKSTNGGNSWIVLPPPPGGNFLWLSKIIINPLDNNILYVSGSSRDVDKNNGRGVIFRSDDAGLNWYLLYTETLAPISAHIADIDINPSDTTEIIIGTTLQALISGNSGATFTSLVGAAPLITTVANWTGRRCELAYCTTNPNTIYTLRYVTADSNNDGTTDGWRSELWQTLNGGASWSLLTNTNGGASATDILGTQGNYDNAIWVDPTNCNRVLLGGINLWKWNSGTLTRITQWQDDIGGNGATGNNNSVHSDFHLIIEDPQYDGSGNTRVYLGNDGGIYKSDNIWTASVNSGWTSLVSELNITQLYGVDVSLTGDTLIGGAQDNSYFVQRGGNNSSDLFWNVYSTGDGGNCAIKKSNPEIMYSSIQGGNIFKSTNGGDTFCRIMVLDANNGSLQCNNFTIFNDNPIFIAPLEMDPNDDTRIYSGGERLVRSNNEGLNWAFAKSDTVKGRRISTIEIAIGDTNKIWVGYSDGTVSLTINGGSNWTPVDGNGIGLPNQFITDIAVNPGNHNEVLVTVAGGYTQNAIFYTNDAGQTWTNRSLAFPMLVNSTLWHPENDNWVYVGTDLGIFASEDKGQNWSVTALFTQSEGPVYTSVTELVWQGNGTNDFPYYLVAATHGRGVWRTKAPVRTNYYVDRLCSPCGEGSFTRPYKTFIEAVDAAGSGSNIYFLSAGTYDEVPPALLLEKRIKVRLHSSVNSSVLIR